MPSPIEVPPPQREARPSVEEEIYGLFTWFGADLLLKHGSHRRSVSHPPAVGRNWKKHHSRTESCEDLCAGETALCVSQDLNTVMECLILSCVYSHYHDKVANKHFDVAVVHFLLKMVKVATSRATYLVP
eukprot:scaffold165616_cov58-Attheya_sp.AAC.4